MVVPGADTVLNNLKGATQILSFTISEEAALADRVLPAKIIVLKESTGYLYLTDGETAVKDLVSINKTVDYAVNDNLGNRIDTTYATKTELTTLANRTDPIIDTIKDGEENQVAKLKYDNTKKTNVLVGADLIKVVKIYTDSDSVTAAKAAGGGLNTVFNNWYRFSHGTDGQNLSNSDHKAAMAGWSYNSSTNAIQNSVNTVPLVGFASKENYDDYMLKTRITGSDTDDDFVGILLAFMKDSAGKEHTISMVRRKNTDQGTFSFAIVYDLCGFNPTGSALGLSGNAAEGLILADGTSKITNASGGWKSNYCYLQGIRKKTQLIARSSQLNSTDLDVEISYSLPTSQGSLTTEQYNNIAYMLSNPCPCGFVMLSQAGIFYLVDNDNVFDDNNIYDVPNDTVWKFDAVNSTWVASGSIGDAITNQTLLYNEFNRKLYAVVNNKLILLATAPANEITSLSTTKINSVVNSVYT